MMHLGREEITSKISLCVNTKYESHLCSSALPRLAAVCPEQFPYLYRAEPKLLFTPEPHPLPLPRPSAKVIDSHQVNRCISDRHLD
ncbi:hypothetical protein AAFF_G00223980 [Aldrovandia affinis]|uniref:Uncharacterized protein n=1 Tax=Aldrovandia affinis TaxID=143900 RepID=A0AAD7X264_9TELE|nr:hypothetical protein AAFF_G00223980 [Aldrovandia affinis]